MVFPTAQMVIHHPTYKEASWGRSSHQIPTSFNYQSFFSIKPCRSWRNDIALSTTPVTIGRAGAYPNPVPDPVDPEPPWKSGLPWTSRRTQRAWLVSWSAWERLWCSRLLGVVPWSSSPLARCLHWARYLAGPAQAARGLKVRGHTWTYVDYVEHAVQPGVPTRILFLPMFEYMMWIDVKTFWNSLHLGFRASHDKASHDQKWYMDISRIYKEPHMLLEVQREHPFSLHFTSFHVETC